MSNNSDFEFFCEWFGKEIFETDEADFPKRGVLIGFDSDHHDKTFLIKNKDGQYWLDNRYVRPIKELKYIPYTLETVPWPLMFKGNKSKHLYSASQASDNGVFCGEDFFYYIELFEQCSLLDGSPCGIVEGGSDV